ncbi:MAG: acetoacetate metabolism regulatory protein AtoC [Gemmatimonadales bacterium]|nr:MAG: acetoacetate metabolism regulatory protein AtoC [Gemmatimonadales bacterium]
MPESVLLIDDDPDVRRALGEALERSGFRALTAGTATEGLELFEREYPAVTLLDLRLPDADGLQVLETLKSADAVVIMLTGHAEIETAVRAMQLGAENYLPKPVDLAHLMAVVARAADKVRLKRQLELFRRRDAAQGTLGVSPKMQELERQIDLIAAADRSTVLLTGESGTGKGRVARIIHDRSPRAAHPFVDLNAAGLSTTFLESELFGHERGAFTDAKEMKRGLFEVADRGSLFLDEVGELAPELQPKLLKVLETKTFRRLGGTREITVDVRLLAATNRDLPAAVEQGRFREDLYYRLNVAVIHLPPVRERTREDRLYLIERILAEVSQEIPGSPQNLDPEALELLLNYSWPGNVREMRNAIERSVIMARNAEAIEPRHLPPEIRGKTQRGSRRPRLLSLADVEREHIARVLAYHQGNRSRTARDLGISRATLIKKIKQYQLDLTDAGAP